MNLKRQFIESTGRQLYTASYFPSGEICDIFIFCHPLQEEKKSTQRFFVELARKLISKKIATVMFDLSGCGESTGKLADFTYADWLDDFQAIVSMLKNSFPTTRLNFLAVRFAAIPVLQTAQHLDILNRLIVIDPVLDGNAYLEELFRQKLVREMVTYGESQTDSLEGLLAYAKQGNVLDLDGVAFSWDMYQSISEQKITELSFPAQPNVLLIQQSPQQSLAMENNQLMDILEKQNIYITAECITCPPFWKAVDLADLKNIITIINNWL